MTFNADQKLVPHIQVVVPLLFNTDPRWAELAPQFAQSLATIPVGGGTPLYQAILNGYLYALEEVDPTITNRMIVLTDGKDEAARGVIDEPTLITQLQAARAQDKPISLVLVAIGPDADGDALKRVADATGATFLWVRDFAEFPATASSLLYGR